MSTSRWVEIVLGIAAGAVYFLSILASDDSTEDERTRRQISLRTRRNNRNPNLERPVQLQLKSVPIVQTTSLIVAVVLFSAAFFGSLSGFRLFAAAIAGAGVGLIALRVLAQSIPASMMMGSQFARASELVGSFDESVSNRFDRLLTRFDEHPGSATESRSDVEAITSRDERLAVETGVRRDEPETDTDLFFDLEDVTIREIMVPRVDIVAVEVDDAFPDVLESIMRAGHSRIPVFRDSIDHVLGILYVKDLLPYTVAGEPRPLVEALLRPAFVVPESKQVTDLFRQMRRERVHIAVVADEYGGTAGLVTIEDIIEEIVGEIRDEYDAEVQMLEVKSDEELIADGRLPVADAEQALGVTLVHEDDDFETLGGLVHARLGRLPAEGDSFDIDGIHVEVLDVDRHRVRRVRLVHEHTLRDSGDVEYSSLAMSNWESKAE